MQVTYLTQKTMQNPIFASTNVVLDSTRHYDDGEAKIAKFDNIASDTFCVVLSCCVAIFRFYAPVGMSRDE